MFLKSLLNKYCTMNQQVCSMMLRVKLFSGTNTLLHVNIPEDTTAPQSCKVNRIDYSGAHYLELKHAAVWLSKFISLYMKEVNGTPFNDQDFDGGNIR